MKKEKVMCIQEKMSGVKIEPGNENKWLKAIIINFDDERCDIVVKNDNFGTRRKYADFTNGKKEAGLNPMQIVYSGLEMAEICHERYIGVDDKIHTL